MSFKKGQAVTVKGTKNNPDRRPGKFVQTHPGAKGNFLEVLLDTGASAKFRESQVAAA